MLQKSALLLLAAFAAGSAGGCATPLASGLDFCQSLQCPWPRDRCLHPEGPLIPPRGRLFPVPTRPVFSPPPSEVYEARPYAPMRVEPKQIPAVPLEEIPVQRAELPLPPMPDESELLADVEPLASDDRLAGHAQHGSPLQNQVRMRR